ncbi:MAG: hypothetical protein WBV79_19180, partial [Rhodomicrobium sp.]
DRTLLIDPARTGFRTDERRTHLTITGIGMAKVKHTPKAVYRLLYRRACIDILAITTFQLLLLMSKS